ncbi:mitochondrial ribosome-associated GTPase 2-like [Dorcoceras hygrometricum]|uniref:Mitochondrial ribosome-associated GTPase 2-like n=1 Tax=Dorcoceras hygrometricum TaxID=472368 RepID=A0A2Z7C1T5_9LAMI|nr:mitochondrial ribosome-associated GTPase 2-like [Dorcoceras hygrometricum]
MWLGSRYAFSCLELAAKSPKSLCRACSYSEIPFRKTKTAPLQERRMIDRFRLRAKGGEGGNGCTSFRRSRHDRHGKPDGGNGGRGGDVILECSASVWDFSRLQHHTNAKRGGHGASKNMIGCRGSDKIVQVPVGTVIHLLEGEISSLVEKESAGVLDPWDIPGTVDTGSSVSSRISLTCTTRKLGKTDMIVEEAAYSGKGTFKKPICSSEFEAFPQDNSRNRPEVHEAYSDCKDLDDVVNMSVSDCEEDFVENEEIQYNVAELTYPGQQIIVASGGEGGLGNIHSAKGSKSNLNEEVSGDGLDTQFNHGLPGSEVLLLLELKSIGDVGLIGMPNAGKSTLLGAISRAKPTVGHYAFTTLRPNLGKLNYDDISITVADIPGLIRGAHENRGLGHAFLRHVERTRVLAYVVDLAAALNGRKGIPPWEQLQDLLLELEFYQEGLSDRPSVVVANKIDEDGAEAVYEELKQRVSGVKIFPVCAVLGEGVGELKSGLKMLVNGEDSSRLKKDNIILG